MTANTTGQSSVETLNSWKTIANYLNRSVRTVRRWEALEGLPVHRHRHTRGHTVYAYRAELDAWREAHNAGVASEPASTTRVPARSVSRQLLPLACVVSVIALSVAAVWNAEVIPRGAVRSAPSTGEHREKSPAWALVTSVDNRTDLGVFDDSFVLALQRAISNDPRLRPLPEERIERALKLMRRADDTQLDCALGLEVAVRDGAVDALLVPRAEKVGPSYLLSVDVMDPVGGIAVASPSAEIVDLAQILPVFHRLAREVSDAVQNRRRPEASEDHAPLPKVTTSSLAALKLYAQAMDLLHKGRPDAAHAVLELTVETDPGFASAHAARAWTSRRGGQPVVDYLPMIALARNHSAGVTPAERYFIEGSYSHFMGAYERARASYHLLRRLAPTHVLAADAELDLCVQTRSDGECLPQILRVADRRPHDFAVNSRAAFALSSSGFKPERAAYYATRASVLLAGNARRHPPADVARMRFFPIFSAWVAGETARVLEETRQLRRQLPALRYDARDLTAKWVGELHLALGRTQDADDWFNEVRDPVSRHELTSLSLFARDDMDALRLHLAGGSGFRDPFTALLLGLAGQTQRASALHDALLERGLPTPQSRVIRAQLASNDGDAATALSELTSAIADLTPDDGALFFAGRDMLAMLLRSEGDLQGAAQVLEPTAAHRNQAGLQGVGFQWLLCQYNLAGIYREIGRVVDALRIESRLYKSLAMADADHPLRLKLSML